MAATGLGVGRGAGWGAAESEAGWAAEWAAATALETETTVEAQAVEARASWALGLRPKNSPVTRAARLEGG